MPFNTAVPFFTQVDTTPDYFCQYDRKVTTDSFYWTNRIIAGLADAHYSHHVGDLEDYQESTMALGHARIGRGIKPWQQDKPLISKEKIRK